MLVIECPSSPASSGRHDMLYFEAAQQTTTTPAISAIIDPGSGVEKHIRLGCFLSPNNPASPPRQLNPPGYPSIASVTLPTLEIDQAMQDAQAAPTLYVGYSVPADLAEVFPGTVCPVPGSPASLATASPAASLPSPESGPSSSPLSPRSGGTRSSFSDSPSGQNTTASPAFGSSACYSRAAKFGRYFIPASDMQQNFLNTPI